MRLDQESKQRIFTLQDDTLSLSHTSQGWTLLCLEAT